MTPLDADAFRDLARSIIRLSFIMRTSAEGQGPSMSGVPRELLRLIVRSPGVSVSELASMSHKKISNVSLSVRELMDLGLVDKRHDGVSRREAHLYPTSDAITLMDSIYGRWSDDLAHWAERLSTRELTALARSVPALNALLTSAEATIDKDSAIKPV